MTVGRIPSIEGGIQPTIVDAKADLITAVAADTPARIGVGANGTILTANSATATGLEWATPAGGGAVVQVVSATTSSTTSSTSTSFVDTSLTATITPTSASNKIVIFGVMPTGFFGSGNGYYGIGIRILRGATSINTSEPGEAFSIQSNSLGTNFANFVRSSFTFTDSPATTSATTYKLQISSAGTGTILANYHDIGSIVLMEVTP